MKEKQMMAVHASFAIEISYPLSSAAHHDLAVLFYIFLPSLVAAANVSPPFPSCIHLAPFISLLLRTFCHRYLPESSLSWSQLHPSLSPSSHLLLVSSSFYQSWFVSL